MLPTDLVAKLNQCAATDLSGPRDHWFNWLARFTTMVAVGLVFELPELRYELRLIAREWIPNFKYRIISYPHREHAAKILAFIGWILIVAGVAGERIAEVKVKNFDVTIQECSDAKVRAATLGAGDAATSAQTAHEELGAVRTEAKALKNKLSAAEDKLAAVSKQADSLSYKLSKTNSELNKINVVVGGRHVNGLEQIPALQSSPASVILLDMSEEARQFCAEIALGLIEENTSVNSDCSEEDSRVTSSFNGLKVDELRKRYPFGVFVTGDEPGATLFANALRNATGTQILIIPMGNSTFPTFGMLTVYVSGLPSLVPTIPRQNLVLPH
jgi:hypothetical protein